MVIFCRVRGITQYLDVKLIIWGWLDAWDVVRYVAQVKEVEEVNLNSGGGGRRVDVQCQDNATSLVRKYNNMVLGGKVINVLINKHLDCCVPLDEDFDAYLNAANLFGTMPVYCYKECIAKAAAHLSGSARLCDVKAKMLQH